MATITAVTMPKWGIEMTEGAITAWSVSVGQAVEKGAPLLDVETAKIVNAVDAPGGGVLRRVLAEAGETLPVGALLGVIAAASTSEAPTCRPTKAAARPSMRSHRDPSAAKKPMAAIAALKPR